MTTKPGVRRASAPPVSAASPVRRSGLGSDFRCFRAGSWLVLVAFLSASPAFADRVALVFGNAQYQHAGSLANPLNDANAIAEVLERLGFSVTTVLDAGKEEMNEALRLFARESELASVATVFYAGHGLEVDGVNYLMPVDARLERDTDVPYESVSLDSVLAASEEADVSIVILDACRNNPLAQTMQGTFRSVSRGSFGELDEELLPSGMLVAYAAAAGTTAADGSGSHSPYTQALLEHLETPNEIGLMFRKVGGAVIEMTKGSQKPHMYIQMPGEFFLSPEAGGGTNPDEVADAGIRDSEMRELGDEAVRKALDIARTNAALAERLLHLLPRRDDDAEAELEAEVDTDRSQEMLRFRDLLGNRDISAVAESEDGATDLHLAAALNEPELVELAVDEGVDVNAPLFVTGEVVSGQLRSTLEKVAPGLELRRNGQTPLHVAAAVNAVPAARALLDRGADVNSVDHIGRTALHVAASGGNSGTVAELLRRGADRSLTTKNGEVALDLAMPTVSPEGETLQLLIRGQDVNKLHSVSGWAPLHVAAFLSNTHAIGVLLGRGAEVDLPTADGHTALHFAAQAGSVEVIRQLAGKHATLDAQTVDGRTPLHMAAARGTVLAIRELIRRDANVNVAAEDGTTPLHAAAIAESLDGIKELVAASGVDLNMQSEDGWTPLHLAADGGRLGAVLVLLRGDADVNLRTVDLDTAVHLAAKSGLTQALGSLVDRGASLRSRNRDGETPLHKAALHGHVDAVVALLDAGLDVNAASNRGATPLHYAATAGSADSVRALLARGGDERLSNDHGERALHRAAAAGHAAVIQEFAKHGRRSRVDAANRKGETALHLAALSGSVEGVEMLLARGAGANRQSQGGETPLHMAAAGGHGEVILQLVREGADVNRQAKHGVTPLHMAAAGGGAGAVRALLERRARHRGARNGVTPLHMAAAAGHVGAIRALLEWDPSLLRVSADRTKPSDRNTLWWLSLNSRAWLQAKGPRVRQQRPVPGVAPLEWAEALGHTEAAKVMRTFR